MESISYYFVVIIVRFLNLLPFAIRFKLVQFIVYLVSLFIPSFNKVSLKNLRQVFPEASEEEILKILHASRKSFSRFIIDCARFDRMNESWYLKNIETPFNSEYKAIKERNSGKGILVASGHMGSIEFQAYVAPIVGRKFSFIARSFKNKKLNTWWNSRREKLGNKVIERNGAISKVIENLNAGIDTAILIDQNIRIQHAVFVDWFGRPGATTFALGHVAVETKAPIVLSAIVGNDKGSYRVVEKECCVRDIIEDIALSKEQKIWGITDRVSKEYQGLIRAYPSEWFWMHRRWKTTPEGVKEDFYE